MMKCGRSSAVPSAISWEVTGLAREDLELDAGRLRVQWTLGVVDGKPTWKRRPKTKAASG